MKKEVKSICKNIRMTEELIAWIESKKVHPIEPFSTCVLRILYELKNKEAKP